MRLCRLSRGRRREGCMTGPCRGSPRAPSPRSVRCSRRSTARGHSLPWCEWYEQCDARERGRGGGGRGGGTILLGTVLLRNDIVQPTALRRSEGSRREMRSCEHSSATSQTRVGYVCQRGNKPEKGPLCSSFPSFVDPAHALRPHKLRPISHSAAGCCPGLHWRSLPLLLC